MLLDMSWCNLKGRRKKSLKCPIYQETMFEILILRIFEEKNFIFDLLERDRQFKLSPSGVGPFALTISLCFIMFLFGSLLISSGLNIILCIQ